MFCEVVKRHVRDGREPSSRELSMQVAAATGLAQQIDEWSKTRLFTPPHG
jgi:hypothetical protein